MHALNDQITRRRARLAGLFYILIAVFGAFAIGFVPSQVEVAGDAATTASNLIAKRGLLNLGLGADALVMCFEIMAITLLYLVFRRVNEVAATAAALARFGMVAVMGTQLFFAAGALHVVDPAGPFAAMDEATRLGLSELMLHMQDAGIWIWQVLFGFHLLLLGWLVKTSGAFPRLFGYGLMIGAFGYFADTLFSFAFPEATLLGQIRVVLLVIVSLSEVGFALWLAIRGPRRAGTAAPAPMAATA